MKASKPDRERLERVRDTQNEPDYVDGVISQWKRERPDLDLSSVAVIARVSRLSRLLEAGLERVLIEHGINDSGFGVLAALRRAGPPFCLSPKALHNSLLITSGAMTNRLDRLAERGLLHRLIDPRDRRRLLIALTTEGQQLIDQVITDHVAEGHRLLTSLAMEDKKEFARIARLALNSLDAKSPIKHEGLG